MPGGGLRRRLWRVGGRKARTSNDAFQRSALEGTISMALRRICGMASELSLGVYCFNGGFDSRAGPAGGVAVAW